MNWIVDASIFSHASSPAPGLIGAGWDGVRDVKRASGTYVLGVLLGLCSLLSSLSVCETSYEGHMVDALASRADEGRRSLR